MQSWEVTYNQSSSHPHVPHVTPLCIIAHWPRPPCGLCVLYISATPTADADVGTCYEMARAQLELLGAYQHHLDAALARAANLQGEAARGEEQLRLFAGP